MPTTSLLATVRLLVSCLLIIGRRDVSPGLEEDTNTSAKTNLFGLAEMLSNMMLSVAALQDVGG